jgi:hypothetical protein
MAGAEKQEGTKKQHRRLKVSIIPVLAAIITATGMYYAF